MKAAGWYLPDAWRQRGGSGRRPTRGWVDSRLDPGFAEIDFRDDLAPKLQRLTPRQREVLVLRVFGGLRFREIAETLGITTACVHGYFRGAAGRLCPEATAPAAGSVRSRYTRVELADVEVARGDDRRVSFAAVLLVDGERAASLRSCGGPLVCEPERNDAWWRFERWVKHVDLRAAYVYRLGDTGYATSPFRGEMGVPRYLAELAAVYARQVLGD